MGSSVSGRKGVFYLLGNLGYQFGGFPVLPFISEGTCSIAMNMIFAGLVISAYRYDRVIINEEGGSSVSVRRRRFFETKTKVS